jgi:hypothetical protein
MRCLAPFVLAGALAACGTATAPVGVQIVAPAGTALQATAGDALKLTVVQTMTDGTMQPLPEGAKVTWTAPVTVTTLSPTSSAPSPIPAFGAAPTANFIDNSQRPDHATDLAGTLFVLDPGTQTNPSVDVAATVTGLGDAEKISARVLITETLSGDPGRGAKLYGVPGWTNGWLTTQDYIDIYAFLKTQSE